MLFVFIPLRALNFRGINRAWLRETQNVSFQMSYISSPGGVNYFPVFKQFFSAESVSHLSLLDTVITDKGVVLCTCVEIRGRITFLIWEDSFFRLLRNSSKVSHVLFHLGIFDQVSSLILT